MTACARGGDQDQKDMRELPRTKIHPATDLSDFECLLIKNCQGNLIYS